MINFVLTWNDKKKSWLLTAFEKKNSVSDNTTDTVGTLPGEGNDTATSQDTVSGNKFNSSSSNIQTSGEENSQLTAETPKPQPVKETPAAYTITVGGRIVDSPMEIKVADNTLQNKLEFAIEF